MLGGCVLGSGRWKSNFKYLWKKLNTKDNGTSACSEMVSNCHSGAAPAEQENGQVAVWVNRITI